MLYLNKYEIFVYFFVYVSYLVYGISKIYQIRDKILDVAHIEFDSGWIGRAKDTSSDELENFKNFVSFNYSWYVIHAIVSELSYIYQPQRRNFVHGLIGSIFVVTSFQIPSTLIIFTLFISYYTISRYKSKSILWILSAGWIFIINMIKTNIEIYEMLGYQEYYLLIITLSWGMLKCLSFSLNLITYPRSSEIDCDRFAEKQLYSASNYFGYILYFPTLIFGPFMRFTRYIIAKEKQPDCWMLSNTKERLKILIIDISRTIVYYMVLDIMLHFCYVHYLGRDLESIKLLHDTFGLYALGYFMGLYFFLCYTITYGLGIAFARFDNLNPPERPRCIGRIHFYSDMWKYFDQGLYEFLFAHIYTEICSKTSPIIVKLLASCATFSFIYIWHGHYMYILIWSILNLICLLMEKFFKHFITSTWYKRKVRYLSRSNQQRLYALLATQIYIPSAFSNIYFIAGKNIGDYFMIKTYKNGFGFYAGLTICCYCFFQSSEVIYSWESQRAKNGSTKSHELHSS